MTGAPPPAATATERLVRLLRERRIRPAQKLPTEAELCRALGISRPALRETLSALEAIGCIESRQGSGRVLRSFDDAGPLTGLESAFALDERRVADLLDLRRTIEINVLPAAVARLSRPSLAALAEVVSAMERRARDGRTFEAQDRRFHDLLYRDLDNQALRMLLDLFWRLFMLLDPESLRHAETPEQTIDHHRCILAALARGDARHAQSHLDAHFHDVSFALASPFALAASPAT